MKRYLAYIRVSTAKQGERGSSLQEQRSAIEAFASRQGLNIVTWFEERETAAKEGRRMFSRMLGELARGGADGVIIHKIDRGARNLRDWANLGDLIDRGIDVQFVHDNFDLQSRGGRLSADIQAVVAADYIRNLRDEVKKGFYGRLKQGLYPLPAPCGYFDRGRGQPKQLDPVMAPLVRQAFELYATNRMSVRDLHAELSRRGLRSRHGQAMGVASIAKMLHNPFYMGLIRVARTNEIFAGIHTPIVTKSLFDRVQAVLAGKTNGKAITHEFTFRRFIRCGRCQYHLVGERKKGRYVYYRCFNPACRGAVMREQDIDDAFEKVLALVRLSPKEIGDLRDMAKGQLVNAKADIEAARQRLGMKVAKCDERLTKLTDALVDGIIEKDDYERRKETILRDRQEMLAALSDADGIRPLAQSVLDYLELRNIKDSPYKLAIPSEKRAIADIVTWNFEVVGKSPAITLKSPYQDIVNWRKSLHGGPRRDTLGTECSKLLDIFRGVAREESLGASTANDNVPPWKFRRAA